MDHDGFDAPLSPQSADELRARARAGRGIALTATSVAGSGHPGGSLSSMEMYTLLFSCARLRAEEPRWPNRDRIVVSHGHTSPGVYGALSQAGFFPAEDVEAHFRQAGSVFEGHVERSVPGVDWGTGNLGQGLSAGVGMALGARLTGGGWHTFVAMSDGEQHKGQIAEARRLAVAQGITDLTVVLDVNGIQISGETAAVMPVSITKDFEADGWRVIEVDGHDIDALHGALRAAVADTSQPVAIAASTVIGKGVSFMEGKPEFHGRGLKADEYDSAMAELGLESRLEAARAHRSDEVITKALEYQTPAIRLAPGTSRTYGADAKTDNRSAWGRALTDIADDNPDVPVAVLDCDLAVSVKTDGFAEAHSDGFIQCGVGEHNAATVGGALSTCGVLTFWADFGVFACDEVYNQQRLNDINGAALKAALTHCGVDVGEDGKTHQCLDYVGAFRELFGWKVIVPADPNMTDKAVRAAASLQGNVAIAMGRSKLPAITDDAGQPLFADSYVFEYGTANVVRDGADAYVLAMGTSSGPAVEAVRTLAAEGLDVGAAIVSCPLDLDDGVMQRATEAGLIVTVEDHNVRTGLGASVAGWLASHGSGARLVSLGLSEYQPSGAAADLYARAGLDVPGIADAVRREIGR